MVLKYDYNFKVLNTSFDGRVELSSSSYRARRVLVRSLHGAFSKEDKARLIYEFRTLSEIDLVVTPEALHFEDGEIPKVYYDCGGRISLRDLIETRELSFEEIFKIGTGVAEALKQINELNLVHAALTPEAILVDPKDLSVQLFEFRYCVVRGRSSENISVLKPDAGQSYIAPEQTGRSFYGVDSRTDLFSLGVILYELIAGKNPFEAPDHYRRVYNLMTQNADRSALEQILSPLQVELISKLLEKNPDQRYQSPHGLLTDLKKLNANAEAFALGGNDLNDHFEVPTKIYGRKDEFQILADLLQRVSRGSSHLVNITGYSGIGKSSIVDALQPNIFRQKSFFGRGKFEQFLSSQPYSAISAALDDMIVTMLRDMPDHLTAVGAQLSRVLTKRDLQFIYALSKKSLLFFEGKPALQKSLIEERIKTANYTEYTNGMNAAFETMVNAVARPNRPVTLFFDDMQWADQNSLELIERSCLGGKLEHILLVVAYRSNEMPQSHPYSVVREQIADRGGHISYIDVPPLDSQSLTQLLCDCLQRTDTDQVSELEVLIREKTDANPIFFRSLLNYLYQEGKIRFDYEKRYWAYDAAGIEAMAISSNVVDLLIDGFKHLPEQTKDVLNMAACMGSHFALSDLASIAGKSEDEIVACMSPALANEHAYCRSAKLKLIESGLLEAGRSEVYYFAHDRIQQASYEIKSPSVRRQTHLKVARFLRPKLLRHYDANVVFEVANHYRECAELLSDDEKAGVCEICYDAGRLAYEGGAFGIAVGYLEMAQELRPFRKGKADALDIEQLLGETYLAAKNVDAAMAMAENLVERAQSDLDLAQAYFLLANIFRESDRINESVPAAMHALQLLGLKVPKKASLLRSFWYATRLYFLASRPFLRWLSNDDSQAEAQDPKWQLIERIYATMGISIYLYDANYLSCLCFFYFSYFYKHNVKPRSSSMFAVFGIVMISLRRRQKALLFRDLAEAIEDKVGDSISSTLMSTYKVHFLCTLDKPVDHGTKEIAKRFDLAVRLGNHADAVSALNTSFALMFIGGFRCYEAKERMRSFDIWGPSQIRGLSHCWLIQMKQALKMIDQETLSIDSFSDGELKEEDLLQESIDSGHAWRETFYFFKTIGLFWNARYEQVFANAMKVGLSPELYCPATPQAAHQYTCFFIACLRSRADGVGAKFKKALYMPLWLLNIWWWERNSTYVTNGFYQIAMGEVAFFAGRFGIAARYFESGVLRCRESKKYFWLAYCYERLADALHAGGLGESGDEMLLKAHNAYANFGAKAVRSEFEKRHESRLKNLVKEAGAHHMATLEIASETVAPMPFDMIYFTEAIKKVSTEKKPDRLAEKVLELLLEASDSDYGVIAFVEKGICRIQAEAKATSHLIVTSLAQPGGDLVQNELLHDLFQYCSLSGREQVFRSQKAISTAFPKASAKCKELPRSLLVVPIMMRGEIIAAVALQNSLLDAAYPASQIEHIRLLAGQCAVAISNLNYESRRQLDHEKISHLQDQVRSTTEKSMQLETKVEKLSEVAQLAVVNATIAHDIRNHLAVAHANLQFISKRDQAGIFAGEVEKMERRIYSIADISSSYLGLFNELDELERQAVSSASVVCELKELVAPHIPQNVEFVIRNNADSQVYVNLNILAMCLLNLIKNACEEVRRHDKPFVHLEVTAPAGANLEFRVIDSGRGIPSELREKIFEFQYTTKKKLGGSGLGLSVTQQMVKKLGGRISIEAEHAHTCFLIEIPIAKNKD